MLDGLLRIGEGHHFGVGKRTIQRCHEIHSDGNEATGRRFEHGGSEGSAGSHVDIGARELDDEPHAVASRPDERALAPREPQGPGRKPERRP